MELLMWVSTFVMLIASVIGVAIYRRYKHFQLFKKLGIPGPKPSIFSGNTKDMKYNTSLPITTGQKWYHQYGKFYGYFRGSIPTLVVSDLEVIKKITVRDFHLHMNRYRDVVSLPVIDKSLIGLKGQRWKEVRKLLMPTFSASKMKQLSTIVNDKVDVFCDVMDSCADAGEFDIYDKFQRLTLDVIGRCALAVQMNCQKAEDNDSTFTVLRNFMRGVARNPFIQFLNYFQGVFGLLLRWHLASAPNVKVIKKVLENLKGLIQLRREKRALQRNVDVLQLMLETEADQADGNEAEAGKKARVLTSDEIVANCFVFLIAGFDTTAATLTYICHLLALHPDVQEKVYKEIMVEIQADKDPTYEEAQNLKYLDQVIMETLRVLPAVALFDRESSQTYKLTDDITIPPGVKIEIPIYCIHHDPSLWPEPDKFNPDRFSPENKGNILSMAYLPFGAGPRTCVGMRFALLEIKFTMIKFLRKYRLQTSENTKHPPGLMVPFVTYVPKNGMYLQVRRRSKC